MDEKNKELYSIFSKAMFPSGNITIQDIINDVTKDNNKRPEKDNNVIIDDSKPILKPLDKKSRKETRYELKKVSSKNNKMIKAKERKNVQLKEIEDKLNKIKLEVKASSFSNEDVKRIEMVLFQK